jgi:hypothetical protein
MARCPTTLALESSIRRVTAPSCRYFTFAWALRRSDQYFFIRSDTAFRAAADIVRVRWPALSTLRRMARRRRGSASSGNVRSMAMISARSCFKVASAPALAHSRNRSALTPANDLATTPPDMKTPELYTTHESTASRRNHTSRVEHIAAGTASLRCDLKHRRPFVRVPSTTATAKSTVGTLSVSSRK